MILSSLVLALAKSSLYVFQILSASSVSILDIRSREDGPCQLLDIQLLNLSNLFNSRFIILFHVDWLPYDWDDAPAVGHQTDVIYTTHISVSKGESEDHKQFKSPRPWNKGNVNPNIAWNFFCTAYTVVPFSLGICWNICQYWGWASWAIKLYGGRWSVHHSLRMRIPVPDQHHVVSLLW